MTAIPRILFNSNLPLAGKTCFLHGGAAAAANPDNKPTPAGREREDPTNVRDDTPSRDEDDSPDWAPGYYDEKGSSGHREVASRQQSGQVSGSPPGSRAPEQTPSDVPPGYKPEGAEDPMQPKPEDPFKPDTPDFDVRSTEHEQDPMSAADRTDPNQDPPVGRSTQIRQGSMPDRQSSLAGMPEPQAPPEKPTATGPASEKATPYNKKSPLGDTSEPEDFPRPAKEVADKGQVKPGQKPSGYSWER